jgi:hypothetical protein
MKPVADYPPNSRTTGSKSPSSSKITPRQVQGKADLLQGLTRPLQKSRKRLTGANTALPQTPITLNTMREVYPGSRILLIQHIPDFG